MVLKIIYFLNFALLVKSIYVYQLFNLNLIRYLYKKIYKITENIKIFI